MNRNYLIVIGLGVATILAFVLINAFSGSSEGSEQLEEQIDAYITEIEDLEGELLETTVINDYNLQELSTLKNLLEEKYTQIDLYEQKIKDLEKLGNVDQETIDRLKEELSQAKTKVVDRRADLYKREIDILVEDYTVVTKNLDSVLINVNRRDSLYFALQRQFNSIKKDYSDCMDSKGLAIPTEPQRAELFARITRYENIDPANDNVRETNKKKLKKDVLKKLKVYFEVEGNSLVPTGAKNLYLVIAHNDGTYYRSIRSREIPVYGVSTPYTADAIVEYKKGNKKTVSMEFQLENDGAFKAGLNTVRIVYDGEIIGEKTLFLY